MLWVLTRTHLCDTMSGATWHQSASLCCTCAACWTVVRHLWCSSPSSSASGYCVGRSTVGYMNGSVEHHVIANNTLRVFNVAMPVRSHFAWARVSSPTETLQNTTTNRHRHLHPAQLQARCSCTLGSRCSPDVSDFCLRCEQFPTRCPCASVGFRFLPSLS